MNTPSRAGLTVAVRTSEADVFEVVKRFLGHIRSFEMLVWIMCFTLQVIKGKEKWEMDLSLCVYSDKETNMRFSKKLSNVAEKL